jgi:hypothetical protein
MGNTNKLGKNTKPLIDVALGRLRNRYESDAKKKGRVFDLTDSALLGLGFGHCFYCDAPPSNEYHIPNYPTIYFSGIDRVDNTEGYTTENVVSCCKQCNYAKQSFSQEDFLNMVKRIYEKHDLQNYRK